jgi:hypothetical protein
MFIRILPISPYSARGRFCSWALIFNSDLGAGKGGGLWCGVFLALMRLPLTTLGQPGAAARPPGGGLCESCIATRRTACNATRAVRLA